MLSRNVPLIGREAEVSHITSALAGAPTAAVVIAGRAGVGKSRLAAEVASLSGRPATHIIATQGGAAIPFGAFASLLPDTAGLTSQPAELIQSFCRAIADRATNGTPLLLVLDDAQFLDYGSAELVHQLVLTRSCALVATLRTPEVAPEAIVSLWKEGLAQRIEIHDLSRRETDSLVASYLGGPVAGSALRWIWDVSAGNPLFVRELLIGAEESGSAYSQQGIWFLRLPLPAPSRLRDLIASRLCAVGPKAEEVVDLVAIGEPLGFAELVKIAGQESVEEAEERGLVVLTDDDGRTQVRLTHPLYREVVQQRIPRIRLRRLSAALADAMEQTGALRRDDTMRVARWRLDAGDVGNPEMFERAAHEARAVRDLPLAARFARAALSSGGGVRAGLVLGETEFAVGHHEEAERVFLGLIPLCRTDEERAMIASARAYNLGVLMGDEQAATAVVEEALSTMVDPTARQRVLVRLAITDVYSSRLNAALRNSEELVASSDEATVRRGRYVRAIALALLGRTEEAVSIAHRELDRHRQSLAQNQNPPTPPDYQPPEAQLVGAVMGHLIGGRLAAAESEARHGAEVALDLKDREFRATFSLLLGWVLVEKGLVADAARCFREGAALNRELADLPVLRWCVGGVALAEAMAGNRAAAAEAEAELSAIPPHWMVALDPPLVDRGRAWALIASGQLTAARAHLRETAEAARAQDHRGGEAILLHELVRLGEAREVAGRLAELAANTDGDLVPAFAAHAAARVAGDASRLEAAAATFEKMGAMMLAAEAIQSAAALSKAEGMHRRASALSRESIRLYQVCGIVRSPLAPDMEPVVPLTKRELEIALLAAPGASSKAIAEQLSISVRTVENHLQRIYSKLGIPGRDGLAAALGDPGVAFRPGAPVTAP